MQTQQNMKKNKRTQGTFFIDAGDTISELLLRVEGEEDGNTELFDICDFSSDETGNVKANAEFICEAVNNYDKLKEDNAKLLLLVEESYFQLQIESNKNVRIAIETDSLRAKLRNEISVQKGIPCEEVQTECESRATRYNRYNS